MRLAFDPARARPLARRWGRPLAFALTVVILVAGVGLFLAAGFQVGWTRTWFDDLFIYTDATRRLLGGEGWYLARQVSGPYDLSAGDVLYPPVTAWFFLPWLVLPAFTFSLIPVLITGWFAVRWRPAAWTWPLLAFCLSFPISLIYVLYANPTVWIAAFVALGLTFGWPGVLVLLKPSLAPFALIGIRSRGWWLGLLGLAVASAPFLGDTLAYPRIVFDAQGGGLLYSALSVPLVALPVIAWIGRRRAPPATSVVPDQTRPDTQ